MQITQISKRPIENNDSLTPNTFRTLVTLARVTLARVTVFRSPRVLKLPMPRLRFLKLRYSLYFGPKGPAICLAQPVGLSVHVNRFQGPKVRQLGLVACKRPGLQPLQFIGFMSPALRAGLGKLVGRCPEKRNSATSKRVSEGPCLARKARSAARVDRFVMPCFARASKSFP